MLAKSRNHERGFTLVELLVAIAVIGFSLSALLINIMGHLEGQSYLRDKTFASWVAMNQLELAQIKYRYEGYKPSGVESGVEVMAGRDWFWQLRTKPSSDLLFVKLDIRVYENPSMDGDPLVSLQGALGSYKQ